MNWRKKKLKNKQTMNAKSSALLWMINLGDKLNNVILQKRMCRQKKNVVFFLIFKRWPKQIKKHVYLNEKR